MRTKQSFYFTAGCGCKYWALSFNNQTRRIHYVLEEVDRATTFQKIPQALCPSHSKNPRAYAMSYRHLVVSTLAALSAGKVCGVEGVVILFQMDNSSLSPFERMLVTSSPRPPAEEIVLAVRRNYTQWSYTFRTKVIQALLEGLPNHYIAMLPVANYLTDTVDFGNLDLTEIHNLLDFPTGPEDPHKFKAFMKYLEDQRYISTSQLGTSKTFVKTSAAIPQSNTQVLLRDAADRLYGAFKNAGDSLQQFRSALEMDDLMLKRTDQEDDSEDEDLI